jgi:mono/diheme cytochrome c family protein
MRHLLIFFAGILFYSAVFIPASTLAAGHMAQETAPQPAVPASTNPVKPTAASQERAKSLYARDCAFCHGENGNGKTDIAASMQLTLGDWTDPKTLEAKSDKELFDAIRKGKGEKMPAEDAARAKNDEVWNLVLYIRGLSKGQPSEAPKQNN